MKVKMPKQNSFKKTNIKTNPFEVHINRSKHQVLGRKLKSDKGMPGISKHKAFKKRKDTLLQEYKMRHKRNQFIDQRIGERNSDMTEDDRIMARFTAERKRMFNKKAMFNLSDSEVLTHRGQTLSEIERFESTRSDDEEDDDPGRSGALKAKFVGDAHFGGGMLTKNKHDRESLIDELINESKKRKAERQRNKEETLEATEKLDEEWKILGQITTTSACMEESIPNKLVSKTKEDDYDVVMRQLKFEPHAQASQRLKTDEEIVKEDKEKLEKLEQERLKQLREIEATKLGNHRSSDDIDDGFLNLTNNFLLEDEEDDSESSENEMDVDADSEETVNNKDKSLSNKKKFDTIDLIEEEDLEDKSNLNEESSGDESKDDSSDEECAMEDLTDLMPPLNHTNINIQRSNVSNTKNISNANDNDKSAEKSINVTHSPSPISVDLDLPYILDVPEKFESFKDLLNNHSIEQQNLILERLLKSNHPTLDPGNKKKILKLAEYIIQYVSEAKFTLDKLANMILHFSIFKEYNKEECLKILVDSLSMKLVDDSNPSHSSSKFVVWFAMLFLKPQGMDVLLPINKPALSFLTKEISQIDFLSQSQFKIGLLYSYVLLQDAKCSSIFYTDAVLFLNNCLTHCIFINSDTCNKSETQNKSCGQVKSKILQERNNLHEDFKLHLYSLDATESSYGSHEIIYLCINLLTEFVKLYRKYPQSKIMFKKIHDTISKIETDSYPMSIKKSIKELKTLLDILQTATLPPVVKAAKKPKALRQYEPSFHVITEGKRSLRGLPADKQEEQKLLHKYKNEMKGAMRELRRDRVFLANVKLGEKARSDAERIKKVKEIFGSAAAQQGELRSLKRKK